MSVETKPTNPKDIVGSRKLPMGLVPETAVAEMATAFLEGALKYGRFNWRVEGVRASIYYDAMKRHQAKWYNGEDRDKETRVRHLASVMACCAIVLDAELCGKLVDDRPPSAPMTEFIDGLADHVKHLQELFEEHHPTQFTQKDHGLMAHFIDMPAEPNAAAFVAANGDMAFWGNRCDECDTPLGQENRSADRHRICKTCRAHQLTPTTIDEAAGEAS